MELYEPERCRRFPGVFVPQDHDSADLDIFADMEIATENTENTEREQKSERT
jgi:hypothetical protein